MTYRIFTPSGKPVTFEDDVPQEEALAIVHQRFPEEFDPEPSGFGAALSAAMSGQFAIPTTISAGIASLGGDTPEYRKEIANLRAVQGKQMLAHPNPITWDRGPGSLKEAWDEGLTPQALGKTWDYTKEALGSQIPQLGSMWTAMKLGGSKASQRVALNALSKVLPSVALAGKGLGATPHPYAKVAGWAMSALAGVATSAVQQYSEMINERAAKKDFDITPKEMEFAESALYSLPMGGLDFLFVALGGGMGRTSQKIAAASISKAAGQAGLDAATEYPTEAIQLALSKAAQGEPINPFTNEEAKKDFIEVLVGVTPVAGTFMGVGGYSRYRTAKQKAKLHEENEKVEKDLREQEERSKKDYLRQDLERSNNEVSERISRYQEQVNTVNEQNLEWERVNREAEDLLNQREEQVEVAKGGATQRLRDEFESVVQNARSKQEIRDYLHGKRKQIISSRKQKVIDEFEKDVEKSATREEIIQNMNETAKELALAEKESIDQEWNEKVERVRGTNKEKSLLREEAERMDTLEREASQARAAAEESRAKGVELERQFEFLNQLEADEVTHDDITEVADSRNIKWDNDPGFHALTRRITGVSKLDDLDPNERDTVETRKEKAQKRKALYQVLVGMERQEEGTSPTVYTEAQLDEVINRITKVKGDEGFSSKSKTKNQLIKEIQRVADLGVEQVAPGQKVSPPIYAATEIYDEFERRGLIRTDKYDKKRIVRPIFSEDMYRVVRNAAIRNPKQPGRLTWKLFEQTYHDETERASREEKGEKGKGKYPTKDLYNKFVNHMKKRGDLGGDPRNFWVKKRDEVERTSFIPGTPGVEHGQHGWIVVNKNTGEQISGRTKKVDAEKERKLQERLNTVHYLTVDKVPVLDEQGNRKEYVTKDTEEYREGYRTGTRESTPISTLYEHKRALEERYDAVDRYHLYIGSELQSSHNTPELLKKAEAKLKKELMDDYRSALLKRTTVYNQDKVNRAQQKLNAVKTEVDDKVVIKKETNRPTIVLDEVQDGSTVFTVDKDPSGIEFEEELQFYSSREQADEALLALNSKPTLSDPHGERRAQRAEGMKLAELEEGRRPTRPAARPVREAAEERFPGFESRLEPTAEPTKSEVIAERDLLNAGALGTGMLPPSPLPTEEEIKSKRDRRLVEAEQFDVDPRLAPALEAEPISPEERMLQRFPEERTAAEVMLGIPARESLEEDPELRERAEQEYIEDGADVVTEAEAGVDFWTSAPTTPEQEVRVPGPFPWYKGEAPVSASAARELAAEFGQRTPPTREEFFAGNEATAAERERSEKIEASLVKYLRKFGLKNVSVKVKEMLDDPNARMQLVPLIMQIEVGLNAFDPNLSPEELDVALSSVMNHEIFHALEELDLIERNEMDVAVRKAQTTKLPKWRIDEINSERKEYADRENIAYEPIDPNTTFMGHARVLAAQRQKEEGEIAGYTAEVDLRGEAVAELFRAYARDPKILTGKSKGLMRKVRRFFSRLGNHISGSEFQDAGDFFDAILSGKVSGRDRDDIRISRHVQRLAVNRLKFDTQGGPMSAEDDRGPDLTLEEVETVRKREEEKAREEGRQPRASLKDTGNIRRLREEVQNEPLIRRINRAVEELDDAAGPRGAAAGLGHSEFVARIVGQDGDAIATQFLPDGFPDAELKSAASKIKSATQEALIARGLPDEFLVYRAGNIPEGAIVGTSLDYDQARQFAFEGRPEGGTVKSFRVRREDIDADVQSLFSGRWAAENELLVSSETLRGKQVDEVNAKVARITIPDAEAMVRGSNNPGRDLMEIFTSGPRSVGEQLQRKTAEHLAEKGIEGEITVFSPTEITSVATPNPRAAEDARTLGEEGALEDAFARISERARAEAKRLRALEDEGAGDVSQVYSSRDRASNESQSERIYQYKMDASDVLSTEDQYPGRFDNGDYIVRNESIRPIKTASEVGFVPRINQNAPERNQKIARGEIEGRKLSPDLRKKYSLRNTGPSRPYQDLIDTYSKEPKDRSFFEVLWDSIKEKPPAYYRQKSLDKYTAISKLTRAASKILGDRYLYADTSAAAAAYMSDRGSGVTEESLAYGIPVYRDGRVQVIPFEFRNHKGEWSTGGFIEIMKPLFENDFNEQIVRDWHTYMILGRESRLVTMRDKEGKGKYQVQSTAADRSRRQEIADRYRDPTTGVSIIENVAENYEKWNEAVVNLMVDTGVINKAMGIVWKNFGDYIPFFRQFEGETDQIFDEEMRELFSREFERQGISPAKIPRAMFGSLVGAKVPKRLKGGEAPVVEPLEAISKNLYSAVTSSMKNVAALRVAKIGMIQGIDGNKGILMTPIEDASNDEFGVTIRVNGEDRAFHVEDPLLYDSLAGVLDGKLTIFPFISKPAELLREMVTRNPEFIFTNMMRDTLSTWVTTGANILPFIGSLKGFNETFEEEGAFQKLKSSGIVGGYAFGHNVNDFKKFIHKRMKDEGVNIGKNNYLSAPIKKVWDWAGELTKKSDAATRIAVYEDVLARTGNETEAIYQAMEVMNFTRRGNSALAKFFTAASPFLNARFQGSDVLWRQGTGQYSTDLTKIGTVRPLITLLSRGMTIATLTYFMHSLVEDDPYYQSLEDYKRDDNFAFPFWGTGLGFLIPIPFEVGFLFKVLPEMLFRLVSGQSDWQQAKESIQRGIVSTFGINPMGMAFVEPVVEAATGYSFFRGESTHPQWMEGMDKPQQAWDTTSDTTKLFSEVLSKVIPITALQPTPITLENLFKGYTATVGSYILLLSDAIVRTAQGKPEVPSVWTLTESIFTKRFLASPEGRGLENSARELSETVAGTLKTVNSLSGIERQQYKIEKSHILAQEKAAKYFEKQVKETRKRIRAIRQDPNMDGNSKRIIIDNYQRQLNEQLMSKDLIGVRQKVYGNMMPRWMESLIE